MKIFLFLADKIKRRTHFLARSQRRWLIPGLQLRGRWGSPRSERSLPSDKSFSGSCKDVGHINRDMHHRDLKPESLWSKWNKSCDSWPSHLLLFSLSALLLARVLSGEFEEEEQGAGSILKWEADRDEAVSTVVRSKVASVETFSCKNADDPFLPYSANQIEAKQNVHLRCLSSVALRLRCPTRLSVRPRAITGTVEKHLAIIHNRICV